MMTTEPKSAVMTVKSGAGRRVRLQLVALSLACAFGCRAASTSPPEAPANPADAAPAVEQTAQRDDERLLTPRQVGRVRLGMSVAEVKRLFPSATFRLVPLPDIPAIVAVKQPGGDDILYFGTERTGEDGGGALPRDDERVTQLVTKDPRFRTAEGVGPGSPLEDATKAYGAATLFYSPDVEYAKFGAGPAAGFGFLLAPPSGQKSAGIYDTSPEETEGGFKRSTRFHPGAKISYVSISDDEQKADGPNAAGQSQATTRVAAPLQSVLGKVKKETKVPVLLPAELPHTLSKQTLYASGEGKPDGYEISLSSRPRCGANSCFVGSFEARRGEQPAFERQVQLAENIKGYYQPLSCGGSCSPPVIEWVSGGVLYHIQLDVHWRTKLGEDEELRLMTEVANSAIRGGAR